MILELGKEAEMPTYYVNIPATMAITVTVEAENEEEAKEKALEVPLYVTVRGGDLQEYETHEQVCEGYVYNGVLNEIEVEEA